MEPEILIARPEAKPNDILWCEISIEEATQEELDALGMRLAKELFPIVKARVLTDIPTLLAPANFFGEAEEYMFRNKIRFSKKRRQEYAEAIHQDFITSLNDTLSYDETDGTISISPYVFALEDGDFYRPAIHYLETIIQRYLDEEYQKTLQG